MAICWLLAYFGEQWKVLIEENGGHLMSVDNNFSPIKQIGFWHSFGTGPQ